MMNLLLTLVLMFAQSTPCNPPWGGYNGPVPLPNPNCGDCWTTGKELNVAAMLACNDDYVKAFNDAKAKYCAAVSAAQTAFDTDTQAALAAYNSCIAAGGNPTTCQATADAAIDAASRDFANAMNAANNANSGASTTALANLLACRANSCWACNPKPF